MVRILYIEDDPIQQNVLSQMLQLYGFEVEIANDGIIGVEKASTYLPDLIIADSKMPRMDGIKAIKHIRKGQDTASIPIFALSARADLGYQEQVLDAGADEVFSKPVDINRLMSMINTRLAES